MTAVASAPIAQMPHQPPTFLSRHFREVSVAVALLILLALLAILHPVFYQAQLLTTCVASAPTLVLVVGMTLIILARHIDISIGSQFSVCSIVAGLCVHAGCPTALVPFVAIITGMTMGAINGGLVAGLGMPSIVVTLATMVAYQQTLSLALQGQAVQLPLRFQWFGLPQWAGESLLLITAVGTLALFACMMRWLAAGRSIYAVGSDEEAARLSGIRPRAVVFWLFVLMGALAGLAAMLNTIRFKDVDPKTGMGLELTVITAVVVGGCAITGGRGTLLGSLLGFSLLMVARPALEFFGVEAHWDKAVQGLVIIAAVSSEGLGKRRR